MTKFQDTLKRALWTFVQAGIAAFLVLAPGIFSAPDLKTAKALAVAAVVAAIAAAVSALKNALLPQGHPAR